MKKVLHKLSLLIGLLPLAMNAQQDAHYTNFMFNKLMINPGYAGSNEVASVMALYRDQWNGLPGAPNTQLISFNMPVYGNKMGIGATVERDEIGFSESWRGSAYYAYRIPIGKGKLGMGLQGTVRYLGVDWSQADPAQLNDQELPVGNQGKYFPNFGVGLFYNTDNWYAGASMPRLLTNSLDFVGGTTTAVDVARERRHVYFMGGVSLPLGDKVRIAPNLLMKYVQNAPFDMDANLSFIFFNRLLVGATYRLGDSIDGILHFWINRQLRLGIGYDYGLNDLQSYNNGSFEAMVSYDFIYQEKEIFNPRFFW